MLKNAKLPVHNTNTLPSRTKAGAHVITISNMPPNTEEKVVENMVELGATISIKTVEPL
jgi:saccharopine dehydrogenase-like NADP-dependent oxidoreductase